MANLLFLLTSVAEAIMAFDAGWLDLECNSHTCMTDFMPYKGWDALEDYFEGEPIIIRTSLGRALF